MREVVIVSAVRTPVGKFLGGLSGIPATRLGALVVAEALKRARVEAQSVNEVILGMVLQAGCGQNPARQAAIGAGVPTSVGAMTINKVCGSGLKAVALAAQAIRAGDADIVVAGGMENMSRSPYLLPEARSGQRLGHAKLVDSMVADGLWDVYNDFHMGETAEKVCDRYDLTRGDLDAFALESHRRALQAQKEKTFEREILPVELPGKKGQTTLLATDEGPRADTSIEALSKLKPAFRPEGRVTAGNAPGCNDGAAALVLVAEDVARHMDVKPLARVTGYATGGLDPEWVMLAPIEAARNLETRTKKRASAYDLVELNEAFAAAAIAVTRDLDLDPAKVNANGGAVALGHPIGASGARILVTLLHALEDRNLKTGLATLCLGGGNAVALAVER